MKQLLAILIIQLTYAQSPTEFKPHMIKHLNKGCPRNSSCTKPMGALFQKWEELISHKEITPLQRFIKNYGVPLAFWTKIPDSTQGITFDSRCKQHRENEEKLYEFIYFTKTLSEIEKSSTLLSHRAMTLEGNQFKEFIIPINTLPTSYDGRALQILQESNGTFFNVELSSNKISLNYNITNLKEIRNISCSKELKRHFSKKNSNRNIYQGSYCKSIWNSKLRVYQNFIFGWSC